MKKANREAHAKINLTLDVTGRLPNGYHTVCMVMQSIGVHDDVTAVVSTGTDRIVLTCTDGSLPMDNGNLAYRAAELFFAETGARNDGVEIAVRKRIPIAAGLAGGSTDGAAVLLLLDELYDTRLGQEKLMELGLKLGADVPFCIAGGTMLAEGIGERLTRLPDAPPSTVLLCKPPVAVSTPAIYRAMDDAEIARHPDTAGVLQGLQQANLDAMLPGMYNVMQPVTGAMHPEIFEICDTMRTHGALHAMMSGSGPSVFGLFREQAQAQEAYEALKPIYLDTFITDFYQNISD